MAVFSGLGVAPLLIIGAVAAFLALQKRQWRALFITISTGHFWILFIALLLWGGVSSLWSVAPTNSLIHVMKLLAMGASALILVSLYQSNMALHGKIGRNWIVGFLVGLAFLLVEVMTEGYLITTLRGFIEPDKPYIFEWHHWNRAACLLSVFIWPVLLLYEKKIYAVLTLIVSAAILAPLESAAAQLAFVGAGACWLCWRLLPGRVAVFLHLTGFLVMLFLPIFLNIALSPKEKSQDYVNVLPKSAVHRLYIWEFAVEKAREKTWIGHGLDASRRIKGGAERIPNPIDASWQFLPIHPHHAGLQIWLELGIIGLLLYVGCWVLLLRWLVVACSPHIRPHASASMAAYQVIGFLAFGIWQWWWLATGIWAVTYITFCFSNASSDEARVQNS